MIVQPDHNATLPAFTDEEARTAKIRLAAQVASMMGRKMEEGDWTSVYCLAKGIPESGWSNLNIDVIHSGLGVEQKLLRCRDLGGRSIKTVCGTTLMHPSTTRSIRIEDIDQPADIVMQDVLEQYNSLIDARTASVHESAPEVMPDMRVGWLLWENTLREFMYFEQRFSKLNITDFYAEWNETPPQGARKGSKSLWIYERSTNQKRCSVTTSAGIKIQPYFDVPSPTDPNLYYFRVQSEPVDSDTVNLWVSSSTARSLERILGDLTKEAVSNVILEISRDLFKGLTDNKIEDEAAVPIQVSTEAFEVLCSTWDGVSDEHRVQLLVESLYMRDS